MSKLFSLIILCLFVQISLYGQDLSDLFKKSDTKITYLGIDYSHVKLIGTFSQFAEAGETGPILIKNKYFDGWNDLVLREQAKYDVKGIFRKENIDFQISDIHDQNMKAITEEMESSKTPNYTEDQIKNFVKEIKFSTKEGFGVMFLCESLNKNQNVGIFHFVIINLNTNEVLLQSKLEGKAAGIGLRNFWAKPIFEVIVQLRDKKYKEWKKQFAPN